MHPGAPPADQGQKALAAIVFTDVVGFAKHANTDEARALAALKRDLDSFAIVCNRFNGAVLKTMGDGMLMRFPSAIQGMQCALELQRILHEQTRLIDPRDVLWHRIGIHLGDVVITNADVFGDGVNVAARLQADAKPGAILLSRTVYDVVKGKLKFPARYVGPTRLKGITEPIPVWEVPPLGRVEMDKRNSALADMNMPALAHSEGFQGSKGILIVLVALALVGCASYLLFVSFKGTKSPPIAADHQIHLKPIPHADTPSIPPAGVTTGTAKPGVPVSTTGSTPQPSATTTGGSQPPAADDPLGDAALRAQIKPYFEKNDFAGVRGVLERSSYATSPTCGVLMTHFQKLDTLVTWMDLQFDATTADTPLTVSSANGDQATAWRAGMGAITIKSAGGTETYAMGKLPKPWLAAIGLSMANAPGTEPAIKSELQAEMPWLLDVEPRISL
jgi:class 3 adenylate cyclase